MLLQVLGKRGVDDALEKQYFDLRVESGDALALFDKVDSVHTMTSLVGFEALLRNKKSIYLWATVLFGMGINY